MFVKVVLVDAWSVRVWFIELTLLYTVEILDPFWFNNPRWLAKVLFVEVIKFVSAVFPVYIKLNWVAKLVLILLTELFKDNIL